MREPSATTAPPAAIRPARRLLTPAASRPVASRPPSIAPALSQAYAPANVPPSFTHIRAARRNNAPPIALTGTTHATSPSTCRPSGKYAPVTPPAATRIPRAVTIAAIKASP